MKKYLLFLFLSITGFKLLGQSSIILPNGNVIPSFTNANRPNTNQVVGQLIYQTDGASGLYVWNGTAWTAVNSTNTGTITNISTTNPLSVTNSTTTPQLSISQANGSTNGFLSSSDWNTFNNKFTYPSIANGSILYSTGTSLTGSASKMFWDDAAGRLNVFSNNNGTGTTNWISGNFGGNNGNRVVLGILNTEPTIGAHNPALNGWAGLTINPGGPIRMPSIAGSGTQMVVVGANGILGSQAIPASGGTVTNVTATAPLSVSNGTSTPALSIVQANGSTDGFLSSTDWNTFNNKQNMLPNATSTVSGILTNVDWNTFNNKQNTLPNANGSTSGILTNVDWNTFNNKFNLPSLTAGSLLFSNGTTIAQNNANLFWDNTNKRLGIGTATPLASLSVNSSNDGTPSAGFNNWIAGNFGGTAGNRVVLGVQNGFATIGAHTNLLNFWSTLVINPGGATRIGSLTGTGPRMVIADANGELSASPFISGADNLGNHTATTNLDLATNKLVGNSGTTGIGIANNGNVTADAAITVTGATTLNNTLNVTGATGLSNSLTVVGATSLNNTLNVAGQTTLANLAGSGNRMVVSNANGVLSTQPIPSSNDNLGNHTATQPLNINNQWISNNATATGIRLNNSGSVGINIDNPNGAFDVGKIVQTFNGTYNNIVIPEASVYSFSSQIDYPAMNVVRQVGQPWRGNSTADNQVLGVDFGVGIAKKVRGYRVFFSDTDLATNTVFVEYNFEASIDGVSWIILENRSVVLTGPITSANKSFDGTFYLNNTLDYRHYRIRFLSFKSNTTPRFPFLLGLWFYEENSTSSISSGGFTVSTNGNVGVGTNTPTANLDVVGSLKFRNGAANNALLVSDASGNATWSLNPIFTNATITNATISNLGVGTASTTNNSITSSGLGGIKISSTNNGTGTTDWIASNVGGTAGDRVVSGVLNGKATIGGHNNALNSWSDLVINPTTSNTVTIGSGVNTNPLETVVSTVNPASPIVAGHNRNLIVNGSIRQAYYMVAVSIPANTTRLITWTHNFGYSPVVMMSTDENGQGGGGNMEFVTYTEYNNNLNEMVFKIRNLGSSTANGNFRWIVVN